MCPTLFTSITRDKLLSVSWTGRTRQELTLWPEIWREFDAPEYFWSPSQQKPRLTQKRLDSRLTGIIRTRLFPLLPGLLRARSRSCECDGSESRTPNRGPQTQFSVHHSRGIEHCP